MPEKNLKHFAVIGLGVFGSYLVEYLSQLGVEVLGIDIDEKKVDSVKQYLKLPIVCDATDRKQLEDAGINPNDIDVAIVAIGESVEASIYTTLLLKDLGIKKIIARALNTQHAKILAKIGVDKVVFPEANTAEHLARTLVSPHIIEEFELSEEYSISEIVAPKEFYKKSLQELGIRTKYKVMVIGIKRKIPIVSEDTGETDLKDEVLLVPEPDETIIEGDVLIVAGKKEDIEKMRKI